ncbi:hypothetical protein NKG05_16645 [Oerskovia sp. M15]
MALTFDNTASNLPVVFAVTGRDDLARTVAAGQTATVETTVGPRGHLHGHGRRRPGRQPRRSGRELLHPDWSAKQSARSAVVDEVVQLAGTFTNTSAQAMQVRMVTPFGESGAPSTVGAGASSTFTVGTGKTEVPAARSSSGRRARWTARTTRTPSPPATRRRATCPTSSRRSCPDPSSGSAGSRTTSSARTSRSPSCTTTRDRPRP